MLQVLLAALWIGPAMSGSWYAPERNGEGFTLQVLDNGTAHAIWFTYPPVGSPAQQAWVYASGGRIEGDRVAFTGAFTTRGPRFGPAFDPAAVQVIPWGTIEFRFTSCNQAQMTYEGPSAWGSGSRTLTRLTALAELECTGKRQIASNGARTLAGLRSRSGAWFDPTHNGEGWNVEELPDGRSQVYWFTYDGNGEQAWTIGVSPTSGTRMVVADNFRPVGARFGAAFDPAQVQAQRWGRLELDFNTCLAGAARYESSAAGFGNGALAPTRLTVPAGAVCLDGTPVVPASATWGQGVSMPNAASEGTTLQLGNMAYVAGGFGAVDVLQRYDMAVNAWTTLAPMPAGKDHPLGVAIEGDLYVTGGNHHSGSHAFSGWRYVVAENRWEGVEQLPPFVQAGAAALSGFAYFSDVLGNMRQFDPRTRLTRTIPTDGRTGRDHSQLVAFQGELWMLGGRSNFTNRLVSIYDPASETWRPGPAMLTTRAGFAAAATPTLLIVAGGEVITQQPMRTLDDVEAIAAGESGWTVMPPLPGRVHGMGGLIHGNAFHVFGGSVVPAAIANTPTVQILRW
jgi:hypothetical protein